MKTHSLAMFALPVLLLSTSPTLAAPATPEPPATHNPTAMDGGSWDEFIDMLFAVCVVVNCVWSRDDMSISNAEVIAQNVVNSYEANGVSATTTMDQRTRAKEAIDWCRVWLQQHPAQMNKEVEADLLDAFDGIQTDLQRQL